MSVKQKIFMMWLKKNLVVILIAVAAAVAITFYAVK